MYIVSSDPKSVSESHIIRQSALQQPVPQYNTTAGGEAMSKGAKSLDYLGVYSVQELHGRLKNRN